MYLRIAVIEVLWVLRYSHLVFLSLLRNKIMAVQVGCGDHTTAQAPAPAFHLHALKTAAESLVLLSAVIQEEKIQSFIFTQLFTIFSSFIPEILFSHWYYFSSTWRIFCSISFRAGLLVAHFLVSLHLRMFFFHS